MKNLPITTNYIIHKHIAKRAGLHYDLRIQHLDSNKLASFAIPKAKFPNFGGKVLAIRTPDHPSKWLKINKMVITGSGKIYNEPTYGAGTVQSVQKGRALILHWERNVITFVLDGPIVSGKFTLVRFKSKSSNKLDTWLLLKNKLSDKKYI